MKIRCDRCKKIVDGFVEENADGVITTAGFYDVTTGSWKKFKRRNEENICDECMFADPDYKKLYSYDESKLS